MHAPVYDLIFSLAQGGRGLGGDVDGRSRAMRIWETIGGASGKARTIRGRLLGSAVIPTALRGMERAGLGRFNRDFSIAEIGRAGVEAMHVVVERLGIEAEHVIFGHIHRRGSLSGDGQAPGTPIWRHDGVTLHNTGNWLYAEALLGMAVPQSPFWPGSMIVVGEAGPPELIELLGDVDREVLAGRAGRAEVAHSVPAGAAAQQAQGVRERRGDGLPRLGDRLRAAGEVDDQGRAAHGGDVAAQHPVRGVLAGGEAHGLGDPRCIAIGDVAGRLRGDVVGREAGAPGRQQQVATELVAQVA